MLLDLVQRDRVATPDPESTDATKAFELFYNKRIAILNGSNSNIGEVDKRLREGTALPRSSACSCPAPRPGEGHAFVHQSFLVFKQERDKDHPTRRCSWART